MAQPIRDMYNDFELLEELEELVNSDIGVDNELEGLLENIKIPLESSIIKDDEENNILKFLTPNSVSLWNPVTQRINFKQLKVGAKVDIRYDIILATDVNNTEAWIRTFIPKVESPTAYIGMLKYKYPYEMSVSQTLYVDISKIRSEGGVIQARTDNETTIILKGMYISVC